MEKSFLKYPVEIPEEPSPSEAEKLLDTVVYYVPEKPSIFYKIINRIKRGLGIKMEDDE